jgi:cytochrome c-type biogenesis protein CcmH/NrfG
MLTRPLSVSASPPDLHPKSDEKLVRLAIALRKKGDGKGANQALAEAWRLNPRSAFARQTQAKK